MGKQPNTEVFLGEMINARVVADLIHDEAGITDEQQVHVAAACMRGNVNPRTGRLSLKTVNDCITKAASLARGDE